MPTRKRGAPKGNRWHWLLIDLRGEFLINYNLSYDYKKDAYFFESDSKKVSERNYFIVIRTSRHCFRMMYYDKVSKESIYKSFENSYYCAKEMKRIFKQYHDKGI